jgi:hypothetical protein
MTREKKAKAAARALKASTGLSYIAARRMTSGPGDDEPQHSIPSIEELLEPYLLGVCDGLADEPIDSLGDIEIPGFLQISEATVSALQINTLTIDVQVIEEYEGGTQVCTVFAEADLVVEGLMFKSDASAWVESGFVKIIDFDHNRHYARVIVAAGQAIEVEFDAIVTLDAESVDDVNFVKATQLSWDRRHPR